VARGLLNLHRPLLELRPKWIHRDGHRRIDTGLQFACPLCLALPEEREHRLDFWFVSHAPTEDLTVGAAVPRLYDHAGTRFEHLTVWTEKPPPRDPLLRSSHWSGYVERGAVWTVPTTVPW
jgi:hypothetical protein